MFYVDLTLREEDNLAEAVCFARSEAIRYQQAGVETALLEATARQLLLNGQFEDSEEEIPLVMEEFYPEGENSEATLPADPVPKLPAPKSSQLVRPARLTQRLGTAKPEAKAA